LGVEAGSLAGAAEFKPGVAETKGRQSGGESQQGSGELTVPIQ
jgi:hypothetical protein